MTRRPCQKPWLSATVAGPASASLVLAVAPFPSFVCSPTTLSAVAPQISQVLQITCNVYRLSNDEDEKKKRKKTSTWSMNLDARSKEEGDF